jgi:hypothetical protein
MSMLAVIAGLLMASADAPKIQFYFGAGAGWAHTNAQEFCCAGPAPISVPSRPDGLALSLEGQVEFGRLFAATSLVFVQDVTRDTGWALGMATGRFGVYLLDTTFSPYLAAGAGFLRELLRDADTPSNALEASGAAILAEAGVAGPRSWRVGKAEAYFQILQPLFDDPVSPSSTAARATPTTKLCLLTGIRIFY